MPPGGVPSGRSCAPWSTSERAPPPPPSGGTTGFDGSRGVPRSSGVAGVLRRLVRLLLLVTVMVAPAFATTSRWAWTMEHRFVSGEENGVLHELDEGRMSFEGEVWAFAKKRGAPPTPMVIELRVRRQSFPTDPVACSASRRPSSTLNERRSFSTDCGREPDDTYYIQAWTTEDDGWDTKGEGTLSTD